jgi:hypothetical protein
MSRRRPLWLAGVSVGAHFDRPNRGRFGLAAILISLAPLPPELHPVDGGGVFFWVRALGLRDPRAPGTCGKASRPWLARNHSALTPFFRMNIREDNCNMVLLAAVTLFSLVIVSGATVVESGSDSPTPGAKETSAGVYPATAHGKSLVYVNDKPQVRVVGAPFLPNINPSER